MRKLGARQREKPTWVPARVLPPGPAGVVEHEHRRKLFVWPFGLTLESLADLFVRHLNPSTRLDEPRSPAPSKACHWAARQYAEAGHLPPLQSWPKEIRDEASSDLGAAHFRWSEHGDLEFQYARPGKQGFWWLALGILQEYGVPLRTCEGCNRFFAPIGRRSKRGCSPKCANRIRAREYYQNLKQKPKRYKQHLKRMRELMAQRRRAGLA